MDQRRLAEAGDLLEEMSLSDEEIEQRKAYLNLTDADEGWLKAINPLAVQYADPVIDAFYDHLLSHSAAAIFFPDAKTLEYVKRKQVEYFLRLTQGNYDRAYVAERLRIGAVHERIGLPVKFYLGSYAFYVHEVLQRLRESALPDETIVGARNSLLKLVFFDISLALDTYIARREQTISQQQEAIRKLSLQEAIRNLSTPVLQIRERLLILPMIGELDAQRARQLTEQLLAAIRRSRAKVVIIDITGVPGVDSRVANRLLQTIEAARLMGATSIVTGLSPEVAQAIVDLGVGLDKVNTAGDLQGGLEMADELLGLRVVPSS